MNQYGNSIAVIHAHPDDTEAWCSGTLFLLAEKGWNIHLATMTAGGLGGVHTGYEETIRIRKEEAEEAARILGATYHCFDQPDGYLFDNREIRIAVTSWLRYVRAGIVLTHLPWDYHSDHRAAASLVEAAAMSSTLPNVPADITPLNNTPLLYHTTPMTLTDAVGSPFPSPHFYVDISSVMEKKMEMLSCHRSQIELMSMMQGMDDFFQRTREYNHMLGRRAGTDYAECFWQHVGGGFSNDPTLQKELQEYITIPH
ncbi:MAG: PIG-L family deacetylase [Spirochaetota bacterium]|nr:PIG-L family deacetylase [Spirochaetota bacterium]